MYILIHIHRLSEDTMNRISLFIECFVLETKQKQNERNLENLS